MTEEEQIFGLSPSSAPSVPDTAAPSPVLRPPETAEDAERQTTPMASLATFVMTRFQENESFRRTSGTTDRLLYALRAQTCVFSDDQRAKLARILPKDVWEKIFAPITSTKVRAARAMLVDLANQSGDPLFRIEPTPVPETDTSVQEKAAMGVVNEITALFTSLAESGVDELPPDAMAMLTRLVETATESEYDAVESATEEYARVRAKRMQKKVWDVMLHGGFNKAFEDYIGNVCTFGTGVLVGPVERTVAANEFVAPKGGKGAKRYRRVYRRIPTYESLNPLDCYPAPNSSEVDDGAFCVTVKYSADELWRFAEARGDEAWEEGWNPLVVRSLLSRHPKGLRLVVAEFEPTRRECERNGFSDTDNCMFEGVRCFAHVRGSDLLEMGIGRTRGDGSSSRRIDSNGYYATETIVVDNRVVYCRIYDDVVGIPISRGVFYTLPGSWWGESIADKVAMCQTVLNNCIRAMLENMSAASGPIYWINDVQRMVNKAPDALMLKANMTVPFLQSMTGNQGAPIGVISVPSNASELLSVWKQMQTQADLDSGIPAFTEGQSAGQSGALRTASGLAMYTEASTRGMKMVMTTTDKMVIGPVAKRTADWILANDPNMDIKGDVEVHPVGLVGKILKAQRDQQRVQLFNLVVGNQFLVQTIGPKGVIALLRPSLEDLDIDANEIVPSKERIEQMELVQGIKQIFEATQASNGVQENAGAAQQGGVEQPPPVQSGVAERRAVA